MKMFPFFAILLLSTPACADTPLPAELNGYEKWPRVTEKPVSVSPELWTLCKTPPPEWAAMNSGPHKGGAMSVRVNQIGRKQFMNEPNPIFLEGTVIVKEKLVTPAQVKPDSLGIMIKRESGWEFAFVDSSGKTSRGREQLANCYDCHAAMKNTDGVFRTYLSKQQNLTWNTSAANHHLQVSLGQ